GGIGVVGDPRCGDGSDGGFKGGRLEVKSSVEGAPVSVLIQARPLGAAARLTSALIEPPMFGSATLCQPCPFQCSRWAIFMADAFMPRAHALDAHDAASAASPPCHDPGRRARDQRLPFHRSISGPPAVAPSLE